GGGDQVNQFRPARVIAFGDENSFITPQGRKFTVNFVTPDTATPTPTTPDCAQHPIWVQIVAGRYGLSFPECPGVGDASRSTIRAVAGSGVDGVRTQVDAFLAGSAEHPADAFQGNDLVTVMTGASDIRALADDVAQGRVSGGDALALASQLGADLAGQVN